MTLYAMFAFVVRVWGVTSGSDDSVSFWNSAFLTSPRKSTVDHCAIPIQPPCPKMWPVRPKSPWFTNMTSKRGNIPATPEVQPPLADCGQPPWPSYVSNASNRYKCVNSQPPLVVLTGSPQLDASLVDLTPSAWDMIAASLPPSRSSSSVLPTDAERLSRIPSPPAAKAAWQRSAHASSSSRQSSTVSHDTIKHPHREQLPSESFVLLQDSIVRHTPTSHTTTGKVSTQTKPNEPPAEDSSFHKPTPISQHVRSTQRLMNLISSRTDVDHPLCAECTHLLLNSLTKQLEETKKERDGYIAFEKEVRKEREREKDGLTPEETEKKIAKLAQEEKLAITQLREAEKEREQLESELKALELEEKALEEEEAEFVTPSSPPLLQLTAAQLLASV